MIQVSASSWFWRPVGGAHGVDEVVGGFGVVELQVHVLRLGLGHGEVVPGVVGADGGLPGLQGVENLIHHVALHQGPLVQQGLEGLVPLGLVGGVHVQAILVHSRAEGVRELLN